MEKVELKDVKPYVASKHFDMIALKLHDKESSGDVEYWMGMLHFLPGGGAECSQAPMELVYFVLEGKITVKTKNESFVLKKWDSIHIMAGDEREVINETNKPATMLLII